MSAHFFIVAGDSEDASGEIECADPPACSGWIECQLKHADLPPIDEALDAGERYVSHGVEHWVEFGMWAIDYTGCIVDRVWSMGWGEWPDGVPRREGRYAIDEDWGDPGVVYLTAASDGREES